MPDLEAGTRKRTYAVIGLVAATTVALTISAASPPGITTPRPALQLAHAPLQLFNHRMGFLQRLWQRGDAHAIRQIGSIDLSFRSKKIEKVFGKRSGAL